jgi:hypothetical protein
MRKSILLLMMLLPMLVAAGTKYKVIAYMSADASTTGGTAIENLTWGNYTMVSFPIDSISLSAIDILILFCNQAENVVSTAPHLSIIGGQPDSVKYFHGQDGNYIGSTDTIIAKLHRLGKKVLLSLTAQDGQDINQIIADSSLSEAFSTSVAKCARRHNFDGIDLNIEHSVNSTQLARYFRIQRRRLNNEYRTERAIFTVVPTPGYYTDYPLSADSCITYYMPQYYGLKTAWDGCHGVGAVWPGNAYSRGHWPDCFDGENLIENGPILWIKRGFPASKIVPGIFSAGYTFPGADSIGHPLGSNYLAETAVWYTHRYQENNGLQERYVDYIKQKTLSGRVTTATPLTGYQGPGVAAGGKCIVTLPNDSTAKYTAHLVDSLGLGGIMTWVLDKEVDKTRPINNGRIFTTERSQYWLAYYEGGGSPKTEIDDDPLAPRDYELSQNYPNPFNPATTIEFSLPAEGPATLVVYDLLGREVAHLADGINSAGIHRVPWNATGLAGGVYFYRLTAGRFTETRRMLYLP